MISTRSDSLWRLVKGCPQVDPNDLAEAIRLQVAQQALDYRTRLLIRDSVEALQAYWGDEQLAAWLARSPEQQRIKAICQEEFERPGFPSLKERLVEKTDPDDIRQFLTDLSYDLRRPLRLYIGGSAALLLPGYLARNTDDIDVVDEVPVEIRSLQTKLDALRKRYGLKINHFQRHYLPMGWEQRVHSQPSFGQIQVYLVDVYDVFLSKLFSARDKDLDDLRALAPQLDKATVVRKMKETTASMLAAPSLREKADKNWNIVYGEPLPS